MWPKGLVGVFFVLCILKSASSKPFLPQALASLASSASASASNPAGPSANISDLTRKQAKADKLRAEKQILEDDHNEDGFKFEDNDHQGTNEVLPSLFQKKINKILAKIRQLSSLSGIVTGTNTQDNEYPEGGDNFDNDYENDLDHTNETTTHTAGNIFQKVIYSGNNNEKPLKLNFNLGGESVKERELERVQEDQMSRFGQIGVFFAELMGSLVGLAYGAAAQLNNAVQGTTSASLI